MEKRHIDRRLAQMEAEGTEFRTPQLLQVGWGAFQAKLPRPSANATTAVIAEVSGSTR